MDVDIEVIKQRKKIYGNNFSTIRDKWEKYLKKENITNSACLRLTEQDVAYMMYLMKVARIEYITQAILKSKIEPQQAQPALQDSIVDRDNYKWIAEHYNEYLQL